MKPTVTPEPSIPRDRAVPVSGDWRRRGWPAGPGARAAAAAPLAGQVPAGGVRGLAAAVAFGRWGVERDWPGGRSGRAPPRPPPGSAARRAASPGDTVADTALMTVYEWTLWALVARSSPRIGLWSRSTTADRLPIRDREPGYWGTWSFRTTITLWVTLVDRAGPGPRSTTTDRRPKRPRPTSAPPADPPPAAVRPPLSPTQSLTSAPDAPPSTGATGAGSTESQLRRARSMSAVQTSRCRPCHLSAEPEKARTKVENKW